MSQHPCQTRHATPLTPEPQIRARPRRSGLAWSDRRVVRRCVTCCRNLAPTPVSRSWGLGLPALPMPSQPSSGGGGDGRWLMADSHEAAVVLTWPCLLHFFLPFFILFRPFILPVCALPHSLRPNPDTVGIIYCLDLSRHAAPAAPPFATPRLSSAFH